MIWFDTLVLDQSIALLHVLRINSVSEQTFGLGLKFETSVSVKDRKVTQCIYSSNPKVSQGRQLRLDFVRMIELLTFRTILRFI